MKKVLSKLFSPLAKLFKKLGDLSYDLKVAIHAKLHKGEKKSVSNNRNRSKINDAIFYCCFIAVPIAFFILTNIIINGNAILLAFQKYDDNGNVSFAGFEHFATLINQFLYNPTYSSMLTRSLLVYVITTVCGTIIPILFSYYVYKKLFGWKIFKVILFIPSILSSIITVSILKMISNRVIPGVWQMITGNELAPLLSNPNTTFQTILFYAVYMGLGGGLLTQLAAMNTVDPSVTESAQLEGIGFFQELWHIVLLACYQVLTLGLVTGVAGIFTNTLDLYAYYGTGAPGSAKTLGYHFQILTLEAKNIEYPYLSAWGLMVTAIVAPLTLLLRHLINKYGPSEESNERKKKVA